MPPAVPLEFLGHNPGYPQEYVQKFNGNPFWGSSVISPGVSQEFLYKLLGNSYRSSKVIPFPKMSAGVAPGVPTEGLWGFLQEYFENSCKSSSGIAAEVSWKFQQIFFC